MRCACYCTAASYTMKPLLAMLKAKIGKSKSYRDVIHYHSGSGDIFYFAHGCFIAWGLMSEQEKTITDELINFSNDVLSQPVSEVFHYEIGNATTISSDKDIISLSQDNSEIKLAISYGLAQSIKLINFEEAVDKTIKGTQGIPRDLAIKGKILLSRKEISKQMGKLFLVRNSINLNSEFLGSPEFFWEYPQLESYYNMATNYLDISKRVEILNKRLDVIHELFEMLTNELHHQHSSVLEWVIIYLIAIEIMLFFAKDVLHWL